MIETTIEEVKKEIAHLKNNDKLEHMHTNDDESIVQVEDTDGNINVYKINK